MAIIWHQTLSTELPLATDGYRHAVFAQDTGQPANETVSRSLSLIELVLVAAEMLNNLYTIQHKLLNPIQQSEIDEASRSERMKILCSMVHNKTILLFCFSMRELVALLKSLRTGWGPPLELVMRRLNSKFWVMEADLWADLLKICRWANPTTRQDVLCVICGDVWYKPQTTIPCGHAFCVKCIYTELKRGVTSCPKCQQPIEPMLSRSEYADKLLELYYEQKEVSEEELAKFCPVVGQKRKREGSAEPLAKKQKSSIQDPAPLDIQQPTRSRNALTLNTLFPALLPVAPKWLNFGLALGITHDTLNIIECGCKDVSECLRKTIQHALSDRHGLTMEDIVKALKSPTVNRFDLVEKVQSDGTTLT